MIVKRTDSKYINHLKRKRHILWLRLIVFTRKCIKSFLVITIGITSLCFLFPLWIIAFLILLLLDLYLIICNIALSVKKTLTKYF